MVNHNVYILDLRVASGRCVVMFTGKASFFSHLGIFLFFANRLGKEMKGISF